MKNSYIYNYVDHLGNVRLSYYKNSTGVLTILEENNYYPFGLKHQGYNFLVGNPTYQYRFGGNEQQYEMEGMYDFGARFYMPDIGRWGVIDEKAEKYRRFSPYTYGVDNPIRFIDPDGRDVFNINSSTGEIERVKTKGKQHSYYLVDGDGNRSFVGSFKYNKKGLVQLPSSLHFKNLGGNTVGFSLKSGNSDRAYVSGNVFASLIGTVSNAGVNDLTINQFSFSDGRSPSPSVSHKDGKNGDLRYLTKDQSGSAIVLGDSNVDVNRQNQLNNALYMFGWKDMISERFSNGKLLDHVSSAKERKIKSDHSNHLHLQGYRPDVKETYDGGEIEEVILTASGKQ